MEATSRPASPDCLRDLVVRGLREHAARAALTHNGRQMTFGDVDSRSRAIAATIAAAGIETKPLVAVCIERSFDLYTSILAPILLGGAYLPLSPDEPDARLASMIERARPSAILTTSALGRRFDRCTVPVIAVDRIDRPATVTHLRAPEVEPMDPAYVIFTSGSTGNPKGAIIPNRAIVNRLVWMARALGITGDDVLLQKTPATFDVSLWEIFLPYVTGARMVIPVPGGHRDVAYVSRLVSDQSVSVIHFVPSAFTHYLQLPDLENESTSLRSVVTSGEALPVELRDRCLERIASATLYNLYGPTEAAVDVTWWKCSKGDPYATVPIGTAIDNVDLYVLDDGLDQVAPGERGELYIGEVAVGSGYLNDPERSAASFLPDHIADEPGRMMYRTGDIVTRDEHGVLEFIGRRDFQVKIRGNRVELGEVECALRATGVVRDCVAVAATDSTGQPILRAYVVAAGRPFSDRDCRRAMSQLLPDYMVPTQFVSLAALPLTPHGKIDRARLPEPALSGVAPVDSSGTPADDPITTVQRIWCEVLGRDDVPTDVNFFDAGGTSLSVLRVLSLIRERLGVRIGVVALFDKPTIADIAAFLEEKIQ